MIRFSPIDKLIIENRKKMNEETINCTPQIESPLKITRRKTKVNWKEYFSERRKSRRLSKLPPDDIKVEICDDGYDKSYDNIYNSSSDNIKTIKKEIDNWNPILNAPLNSCQSLNECNIKVEPLDEVLLDESQDNNYDSEDVNDLKLESIVHNPDILLKSDKQSTCLEENFIENSDILKNVSNPKPIISEQTITSDFTNSKENISSFYSTSAYDNIKNYEITNKEKNNLKNSESKCVDPVILDYWSLTSEPQAYINKTEKVPIVEMIKPNKSFVPKTYSKKSTTNNCSILNLKSESLNNNIKTEIIEENPELTEMCPERTIKKIQSLPKIKSDINIMNNTISLKQEKQEKPYSEMNIVEKKLYREKLTFVTALKLIPKKNLLNTLNVQDNKGSIILKDSTTSKLARTNENCAERNSSDKIRRSYLLEYSNNNDKQKHIAVPILIPEKTSGSSFHTDRLCLQKCSSCHGRFGLLDIPCHLAQIKNPDKQKVCLESVSHLIGPNSCLCTACFRAIEKRNSIKYLQKHACSIMTCKRSATHSFKLPWLNKIKKCYQNKKEIVLKTWTNKVDLLPICEIHNSEFLKISECQLCGNRTNENVEIVSNKKEEFQLVLDEDQIPVTIRPHLLICKLCHVYLLWRLTNDTNHLSHSTDFMKHQNIVLKKICLHNKLKLPSYVTKQARLVEKQKIKIQVPKNNDTLVSSSQIIKSEIPPNNVVKYSTISSSSISKSTDISPNKTLLSSNSSKLSESAKQIHLKPPVFIPVLKRINIQNRPFFISPTSLATSKIHKSVKLQHTESDKPLTRKARVTVATNRLFKEMLKPYHSSKELVNHLLILEKYRQSGDIILPNQINSKFCDKIKLSQSVSATANNVHLFPKFNPKNIHELLQIDNSNSCKDNKINPLLNNKTILNGCKIIKKPIIMKNLIIKGKGNSTAQFKVIPKTILSKNTFIKPLKLYTNKTISLGDGDLKKCIILPTNPTIANYNIAKNITSTKITPIITTNVSESPKFVKFVSGNPNKDKFIITNPNIKLCTATSIQSSNTANQISTVNSDSKTLKLVNTKRLTAKQLCMAVNNGTPLWRIKQENISQK